MSSHCKDCFPGMSADQVRSEVKSPRPIVKDSGGRCATHWRAEKARRKAAAHEKRVQKVYGLGDGDYDRLYRHQGGLCALCERSKGIRKKLAVDHDHETGLTFGLLCGPCNKDVMGWSRRDVSFFIRCIQYLENPPARQLGIVAYHEDAPSPTDGTVGK